MLALRDNLAQSFDSLRSHKLRTALTLLGLTMGVATLITVMTIVQGANVYVEQKIARLGSDVFQISRTPFTLTDWDLIIKALRYKNLELDDMRAVQEGCPDCLVWYYPRPALFGMPVHDGGSAFIHIKYCPWCGANLADFTHTQGGRG